MLERIATLEAIVLDGVCVASSSSGNTSNGSSEYYSAITEKSMVLPSRRGAFLSSGDRRAIAIRADARRAKRGMAPMRPPVVFANPT